MRQCLQNGDSSYCYYLVKKIALPRTSTLCFLPLLRGARFPLVELISTRVPAGVDPAAYVKASFLTSVANVCPLGF